jgi:hypothetical protein
VQEKRALAGGSLPVTRPVAGISAAAAALPQKGRGGSRFV